MCYFSINFSNFLLTLVKKARRQNLKKRKKLERSVPRAPAGIESHHAQSYVLLPNAAGKKKKDSPEIKEEKKNWERERAQTSFLGPDFFPPPPPTFVMRL